MKTGARNIGPKASRERGQTIALVAVAMVSVLGMAALAIDLTTLYVAHGEVQRAADAAALAGAKAFVDSGVTTSPSNSSLQTLAQTMATDFATQVLSQNNVAGAPANFINGTPQITLNLSLPGNPNVVGNPRITVTVQRTDLPIFFAKIFGNSTASVSATAIAEAFNPAYSQNNTGATIPAAPKCVKPFLVPNKDPNQGGAPFVFSSTGLINTGGASFIGEPITLTSDCVGATCTAPPTPAPGPGEYLPMLLPDAHLYCPSGGPGCSGLGLTFQRSAECCDGAAFNYPRCGFSATPAAWNPNFNPGPAGTNGAQLGMQCLIHQPQQDSINFSAANTGLMQFQAGAYSQGRYGVAPGSALSTSDSVITVPLFEVPASWPPPGQHLTIVGFLQIFVTSAAGPGSADLNGYILNVIGCGPTLTSGPAVSGGGASAIPVRLIHN